MFPWIECWEFCIFPLKGHVFVLLFFQDWFYLSSCHLERDLIFYSSEAWKCQINWFLVLQSKLKILNLKSVFYFLKTVDKLSILLKKIYAQSFGIAQQSWILGVYILVFVNRLLFCVFIVIVYFFDSYLVLIDVIFPFPLEKCLSLSFII